LIIKARRVAGAGERAGILAMIDKLTVFAIIRGAFIALWAHASARVECKELARRIATSAIPGETRIVRNTRAPRPLPFLMEFFLTATSHFTAILRATKPFFKSATVTIISCTASYFEAFLSGELHSLRTGTARHLMIELIRQANCLSAVGIILKARIHILEN
jgi:hypothetical protein